MDRDTMEYLRTMEKLRREMIVELTTVIGIVLVACILFGGGAFLMYEKIHDNEPKSPVVRVGANLSCVVDS